MPRSTPSRRRFLIVSAVHRVRPALSRCRAAILLASCAWLGLLLADSAPAATTEAPTRASGSPEGVTASGSRSDDPPVKSKDGPKRSKGKSKGKSSKSKSKSGKKKRAHIRWGQKRNESDAKYDKRYQRLLKRIKQDREDDDAGGRITDGRKPVRLWTFMGSPFIVRSDISKEFTADTAMYMEMLHREYSAAYAKILGVPANLKEKVEVIVFSKRATYMANGGVPGSGGMFVTSGGYDDRGPSWPARRYRLVQFTSGVTDFAKWHKGVLKHEAAHMELRLRIGFLGGAGLVSMPNWFDEGQAMVFEFWDFDKSVDENFKEIPSRGRYAPAVRRLFGTDGWKDFSYVWSISDQKWAADMTSRQGFLNYAQSWSLAAYMINEGVAGRKHFREIYNLTMRLGLDRKTGRGSLWDREFPEERQKALDDGWNAWITKWLPKDKKIHDEKFYLVQNGWNPNIDDKLVPIDGEQDKKLIDWYQKEDKRRKDSDAIYK